METPQEHKTNSERRKKYDENNDRLADSIAIALAAFLCICLLISFFQQ